MIEQRFDAPNVLQRLILEQLTLEELVGYAHLSDVALLEQPVFKLEQPDIPGFRATINMVVQQTLRSLADAGVSLTRQPGDANHIILAQTLQASSYAMARSLANA